MAENEEVDDNSGDVEVDEALLSSDDPVTEGAEGQQEGDGEEESGGGDSSSAPAEECPPCKGGAPAWMATFADMATLLMAFFVAS